ncbi:hypothetical protein GCM10008938_17260 [Deinococcus roseus]|uniref:Uncharacterized protein n=1 Tax=Deinococcus roseus TaxID=392414 RepID=A0ABQ2D074_9DEIO|nr:hypothetical protein GCM10008938_17260 [Deinococcus roseus]
MQARTQMGWTFKFNICICSATSKPIPDSSSSESAIMRRSWSGNLYGPRCERVDPEKTTEGLFSSPDVFAPAFDLNT